MTKFPNLEELLKSDNKNNIVIKLDDFIGELCDYGDSYSNLTEPQMLFYFNQNLEREINNGGFNQYFFNSSGDNSHETVLSLQKIGAVKTADILQKAIDQFPGKTVPNDRDERNDILDNIEESANEVWEELDQAFCKYEDDLNALNVEYIKQHMAFF